MQQKALSLRQFKKKFSTEKACLNALTITFGEPRI